MDNGVSGSRRNTGQMREGEHSFLESSSVRRLRGKWDYGRGILAADDTHVDADERKR